MWWITSWLFFVIFPNVASMHTKYVIWIGGAFIYTLMVQMSQLPKPTRQLTNIFILSHLHYSMLDTIFMSFFFFFWFGQITICWLLFPFKFSLLLRRLGSKSNLKGEINRNGIARTKTYTCALKREENVTLSSIFRGKRVVVAFGGLRQKLIILF